MSHCKVAECSCNDDSISSIDVDAPGEDHELTDDGPELEPEQGLLIIGKRITPHTPTR